MLFQIQFLKFSPEEFTAIWISIKVAILCTIISFPIALFLGWWLARKVFFGKAMVESIVQLPMVLPPVTTGYLLLVVFGSNGFIGKYLTQWFGVHLAFSFVGVVIASTIVSLPLMIRSIRTSIEMVDPALENTARSLGANRVETFFKVTVPLALPGILSGSVLCFARSLGEFGATITFAGNIPGKIHCPGNFFEYGNSKPRKYYLAARNCFRSAVAACNDCIGIPFP
jgi:molybdate transport system permease protein